MIKNLIRTSLLISIFALYLSPPLFATDEFELDVDKHTLKELRKISADNFRKSHIKLNNITSDRKFFDDHANFTLSISYKLLGAIYDVIFTKYKNTPFVIDKIEYTYSVDGEKKKN